MYVNSVYPDHPASKLVYLDPHCLLGNPNLSAYSFQTLSPRFQFLLLHVIKHRSTERKFLKTCIGTKWSILLLAIFAPRLIFWVLI